MGCHRSGTNLLYDTLLSAGGFAVYRGYLPVHKILIPRFGRLDKSANRKKALQTWLRSKGFRRSGLDANELSAQVMAKCRSGGDFIRIVMEDIAHNQRVRRWAVYDPDAVLYLPRIKAEIPEALFVHIIRDGRDIALSLKTMQGFRPFFWDRGPGSLVATASYWAWMVGKGRHHGQRIPSDYFEVHYEELVTEPRRTLADLSQFLDQELDYDQVQNAALGRLSESNSSFREESVEKQVSPVSRWKERLSAQEVATLEAVIGKSLEEFGYPLTTPEKNERRTGLQETARWASYKYFLEAKLWLKTRTPLGRLANLSPLELADSAPQPVNSMARD
jgi:hypothetical protein